QLRQNHNRITFYTWGDKECCLQSGAAVTVTANGDFTLPGFSGSAVGSLDIRVNDSAALKTLIRNNYGGRLVDVLDVKAAE
ncbi:MAG: hypothetical protein D3906_14885, partial [Candidatus Electrothrix sp. AUS1_2]|nr:hypothetical protein [Candidatus Electrothrix sp. AUS1_2]